jgi:hypothetical protein
MHKIRNTENKATAETKMSRGSLPNEYLYTYRYNFTLKIRVYLLILERGR